MDDRIRRGLQRLATRPVVILAVLAAVLCLAGFQWREARLGDLELLDTRLWYTPEQAAAVFGALDRLDSHARAVYAWTEVSIDMIFPVAYGLLLALLLFRIFENRGRLYLLPIAAAVADVFENLSIALLASTYDGAVVLDESGRGLHAAEERADPRDAGRRGWWRDSTAVGGSTTRVKRCPESSAAAAREKPIVFYREWDGGRAAGLSSLRRKWWNHAPHRAMMADTRFPMRRSESW